MSAHNTAQKHRLYHRLQIAAHRAQKAADRAVLDAADITTAQAAVLAVVAANEPVAQRTVADQLGLNESAVTAMVARLMKLALLERERDEMDARAWRLSLSREGRHALRRIEKPFGGINEIMEAALSPEEIVQLAGILSRLAAAFGDEG
ncbi:MAG: MarR family transcriptional regulator [Alphaproteobacteria bacterium]|nr:MAG: MarR family transcriptional regulator [Caulobacteraceae bacterium]TPW08034.1 MAG: MarR family transcriptional regulator [Alphaproteobacteria bacterium]